MNLNILAAIKVTCEDIGNCTTKTKTITDGFANTIDILIYLVGALAFLFIIISGLQIALSNGDPKRYQQGRDGLLYSVIGIIVAWLAYIIVKFITIGFGG